MTSGMENDVGASGAGDAQAVLDDSNSAFWDELCGSSLARQLGIRDASAESLARFDAAYLGHYPYLLSYLPKGRLSGVRVLEIGLGYGTLSGELVARGAELHGVDIAAGPVEMVRHRLRLAGEDPGDRVVQGSALELPLASGSFDYVFSIGCLHHTGNLPLAVAEVRRVLRPGGTTVVMLYNRHSARHLKRVVIPGLVRRARPGRDVRRMYDANAAGESAPHTDFVSRRDVRRLFGGFSHVRIGARNFDSLPYVPRERLLGTVDRLLGLDLYITARK
jgi:SAM-dependent methyltransferase